MTHASPRATFRDPAGSLLLQDDRAVRRIAPASRAEVLDLLAALSEETGLFPDLGFGTTHVNVTVYGADGNAPGAAEAEFARRAGALAGGAPTA